MPGTDLFVQVASVDGVGNPSCWSAPVRVRPDEVTPRLLDEAPPSVGGAVAVSEADGVTAWALGAAGLAVRDPSGAVVTFSDLPSSDVVVDGRTVYGAGGALGVHVLHLDGGGAVSGAPESIDGDDVRALAPLTGGLVLGTSEGVRVLDLEDTAGSPAAAAVGEPVTRVSVQNGFIAVARADLTVQLLRVAQPGTVLGTAGLSSSPRAMRILDDEVWAVGGSTVDVIPLGACPAQPCPAAAVRFQLPSGVQATDVIGWDDRVLVLGSPADPAAGDPGGVFVYDAAAGAPQLVGRAFPPAGAADLEVLTPRHGGFCANAELGGARQDVCWDTVAFPLVSSATSLLGAGAVSEVAADGPYAWTLERAGAVPSVSEWRLADGSELQRASAPDDAVILALVPTPSGLLAVDDQARVLFAPQGARGAGVLTVVDDTALAGAVSAAYADATFDVLPLAAARAAREGSALVVAVHPQDPAQAECRPAVVARLHLGYDGAPRVASVDTVTLAGAALRVSALDVSGGVARVGEKPFAVAAVELDGMTEDAAAAVAPAAACAPGAPSEVDALARVGDGRGRLFASAVNDVAGVDVSGVFDVEQGAAAVVTDPAARFLAISGVRQLLAVNTGVATQLVDISAAEPPDALRAVLTFPNLAQATSIDASARGLVFANGPGGALFVRLR